MSQTNAQQLASKEATTKEEIVSFDSEPLILVDSNDQETGTLDKAACHDGDGLLHRAFSLFIFNDDGELLVQQRAPGKRLWPGFWSNSCCSHPRAGEAMDLAITRRLEQELGMVATLNFAYKFEYQASFGDSGSEHELCSVYLGSSESTPRRNKTEIEAYRWITRAALDSWLTETPEQFTPWFKLEWQTLQADHSEMLNRLLA